MWARLKQVVERDDTALGRLLDRTVQLLIVVSLISFSFETLPDLNPNIRKTLSIIETVTVMLFTAEYLLRILVADHKVKFVFSFYGLIDLLAILPFYLPVAIDLRGVRAFRLLRVFRVLKMARYSRAMNRFAYAFKLAREELVLFMSTALVVFFLSAVGIYYCENEAQPEAFGSVFQSMWWATVTLTTVGYGDVYPITTLGKVFTFFMLAIGVGIVSVPSGIMASALGEARRMEAEAGAPQPPDRATNDRKEIG